MNTQDTRRFAKYISTDIDIIEENKKLLSDISSKNIYIKKLENEISILKGNEYGYKNKIKKIENDIQKYIDHIEKCDKINIEEEVNKALNEEKKINDKNIEYYRSNNKKQLQEIKELNEKLNNNEHIKTENIVKDLDIKKDNLTSFSASDNNKIDKENIINNIYQNPKKTISNETKKINVENGVNDSHQSIKLNLEELVKKKYYIKKYTDIGESEIKKLIAAEVLFKIRYQNKIAFLANDNTEHINMEEVINYIVKQEKLPKEKAKCLRYRLKRCQKLYDTFGDKLSIFKFHMSWIENMPEEKWKIWWKYLEEEIYKVYGDLPICKYIFLKGPNKGMKCNKFNCDNHKSTQLD